MGCDCGPLRKAATARKRQCHSGGCRTVGEALGPETVRAKLGQHGTGRGALIYGFKTGVEGGGLTRGDVEDWQVEKYVQEATMQKSTARWAQIAAWAGIAGVAVGL